ncbi:hypothetical protein ACL63Y_001398 [Campylobacter jejuni]
MLIANKILIENGFGILAIAKNDMNEFFTHLVKFYETNNNYEIKQFYKENCIETMVFHNDEEKTNYRKELR